MRNRSWFKLGIVAVGILFVVLGAAFGGALSANRDTPSRDMRTITLTVKNDEVIYAGAMVSCDSTGEAVNSTDTAGEIVIGRAAEYVDNSADGSTIDVDIGTFRWANGDSITAAHIGDFAYVADNQTVNKTTPANSVIAGIIVDKDSDGVWVDTYHIPAVAGAVTTLSASGAVTFSSTLAMQGVETFTAQPILNGGADINEDIDIDFDATDEEIDITTSSGAAKVARVYCSSGNPTTTALLDLDYNADGDTDGSFIRCTDNASGDTQFLVGPNGATTVATTLDVTGASRLGAITTVKDITDTRVCTSADYGKIILLATNTTVAVTLPANGAAAGSWIEFAAANQTAILPIVNATWVVTISAATADTLIGPNDIDLKSITWPTGHRIGAHARFWSDGFFWHVDALGGCVPTYTD